MILLCSFQTRAGQNMNELPHSIGAEGSHPALNAETKPRALSVQKATVEYKDRCTPEVLAELVPAPGIGAFSRYSPQAADRQHTALITVAGLTYGRVLVAHHGGQVVAYLTFHPPEGECRWASLPHGKILELGGIEVARGYRGIGIARRLMDQAFAPPDFDGIIVYAQALTWCWDLEGTGMSMADYRQMMLRLFAVYGFNPYTTDEPNIRYDHSSLLLGRIGPKTPPALVEAFQALLIEGEKK